MAQLKSGFACSRNGIFNCSSALDGPSRDGSGAPREKLRRRAGRLRTNSIRLTCSIGLSTHEGIDGSAEGSKAGTPDCRSLGARFGP